ncbi:pyridoxal phosphate-dependent aminotransferase [Mucilaginibacter aquaedulcis]|uniref:pyridoxal phosphate-dependent aminotransferase n=1 Tax=Mucilaginibacter aquaedulcis TaxID=1187081 RepID=UPI0025B5DCEB|nr:aminotransferase class I/II-fold pyridoxal phosphate-dependent enzyme [Mucilaginibacter aquaedulcis]MDN3548221.1 aminotransferase class I/II-fold pyridoxal phosphate-dependent enzyme [Mucilaginibacter aquaedulcis]
MLYGHGDDGYQFKADIIADFSTNVWYGGEPEGLKEHIFSHWNTINKYPEVLAESLIQKISDHHSLKPGNILVNSGSTESIYLIAQAFRKLKTSIITPAFAEYEDAARLYEHQVNFIDWNTLAPDVKIESDLIFLCNPNNPTGEIFFEVEDLIRNNSQTLFVVDEAFIEFTLSVNSLIELVNQYPNLIILRSLTKAYAIPGLRLGYIVSSEQLISKLKQFKFPWSVNIVAIETGKFIFDNHEAIQIPIKDLLTEKERFVASLKEAPINIYNSHTHFFLAELLNGEASALKQYLLRNHGILIRDASNFRGLGAGHFRLATLSADKNQLLVNALKEWRNHTS